MSGYPLLLLETLRGIVLQPFLARCLRNHDQVLSDHASILEFLNRKSKVVNKDFISSITEDAQWLTAVLRCHGKHDYKWRVLYELLH